MITPTEITEIEEVTTEVVSLFTDILNWIKSILPGKSTSTSTAVKK